MEVQKASFVQKQQVSCVEIDVPSFQHVPQQLLLRLGLVPSIAQKLADSHQWSHQYPCFSCGHNRHDNFGFTLLRFLVLALILSFLSSDLTLNHIWALWETCTSLQQPLGSKLAERGIAEPDRCITTPNEAPATSHNTKLSGQSSDPSRFWRLELTYITPSHFREEDGFTSLSSEATSSDGSDWLICLRIKPEELKGHKELE